MKQKLTAFQKEAQSVIAEIGHKHGLEVSFNGGSFSDNGEGSLKLKVLAIGEDGQVANPYESDWHKHAKLFGLDPNWLGKELMYGEKSYTIKGFNRRARKNPVIITDSKHDYTLPVETVIEQMKRSA